MSQQIIQSDDGGGFVIATGDSLVNAREAATRLAPELPPLPDEDRFTAGIIAFTAATLLTDDERIAMAEALLDGLGAQIEFH